MSKPKTTKTTKPASPWQQIETAPMDARQILFFWPSEDSLGPSNYPDEARRNHADLVSEYFTVAEQEAK